MQGLSIQNAGYADRALNALPRLVGNIITRGDALPPAVVPIHEVQALDGQGNEITSVNLVGQHSIVSVENGIEQQKTQDVQTHETAEPDNDSGAMLP